MALMDAATPTNTTAPLKCDALGRVCTPRAQREALLDEFERSGLPAARFAKAAGINYQTFATWVQRRRHAGGQYERARLRESSAVRLVEVALPAAVSMPHPAMSTATALELLLPGGARLLLHDASQAELAAHLLRHLNSTASPAC